MDKPFLPHASAEHKAVVIALALCALSWDSFLNNGEGAWQCKMCQAKTPGMALFAPDANHYSNCAVKAAQDGQLQYAIAQANPSAGSVATTLLRIIGEVLKAATTPVEQDGVSYRYDTPETPADVS